MGFAKAISGSLSFIGLALSAGMFEPAPNIADYTSRPTLSGSRIHMPLLVLFIASILVVALLSAYIGFASRRPTRGLALYDHSGKPVSAVKLAALRITNPSTAIQQWFRQPGSGRTTALEPRHMFQEGPQEMRLRVGVVGSIAGFGLTGDSGDVEPLRGQRID